MQAYQGLPADNARSTGHLLPACMQAPLTWVAKAMFMSGACVWLTGPFAAVASIYFSTCRDGAPLAFYAISLVKVVGTLSCEQLCVHRLQTGFDSWPDGEGGEIYSLAFSQVMQKSASLVTGMMGFWPILVMFSAANLLDLETDSTQIGQVRACDMEDPRFNDQYARSFHITFLRETLQLVRIEGLFVALLVVTYLAQGFRGLVQSYKLRAKLRCEVATEGMMDLLGEVAEVAMWSNMHYLSSLMRLSLAGASKAAALAVQIELEHAEAAAKAAGEAVESSEALAIEARKAMEKEEASAIEAQKAMRELSAARIRAIQAGDLTAESTVFKAQVEAAKEAMRPASAQQAAAKEEFEQAHARQKSAEEDAEQANARQKAAEAASDHAGAQQKAAEKAARAVAFTEITTVVLLENAPSLYLTSGFFALRLHGEGALQPPGIVKVAFSMVLSGASALNKASQIAKFGCAGVMTALLVSMVVLYAILKAGLALHCGSGFFSFMTMRCDAAVQ